MFHFSFSFYFEVLFPMTNWNNKHHFRFCVVFLGLGLSVFSTIEGHEYEKEAETVLFNVEIIIVVWFAIEFLIRYVKFFFNTCTPSEEVDAWKIKTFCPLFKFYQLWNWVGYPFLGLSDLELKLFLEILHLLKRHFLIGKVITKLLLHWRFWQKKSIIEIKPHFCGSFTKLDWKGLFQYYHPLFNTIFEGRIRA